MTGSGKSLFQHLVLGQSVPEFSPSTPFAESAVHTMSICQGAVGGGVRWEFVGPQKMMNMVGEVIREGASVFDLPSPITGSQIHPSILESPTNLSLSSNHCFNCYKITNPVRYRSILKKLHVVIYHKAQKQLLQMKVMSSLKSIKPLPEQLGSPRLKQQ